MQPPRRVYFRAQYRIGVLNGQVVDRRIDQRVTLRLVTDLFWPTIATGVVPIRDGPTPATLGSAWLHLPLTWGLLLGAIPIALWFYAAAKALLPRDPEPEAAVESQASREPLALPFPNDELRPSPELAASR